MATKTNDDSENSQQQIANTIQQPINGPTDISTALSSVLAEEKERSKQQPTLDYVTASKRWVYFPKTMTNNNMVLYEKYP